GWTRQQSDIEHPIFEPRIHRNGSVQRPHFSRSRCGSEKRHRDAQVLLHREIVSHDLWTHYKSVTGSTSITSAVAFHFSAAANRRNSARVLFNTGRLDDFRSI